MKVLFLTVFSLLCLAMVPNKTNDTQLDDADTIAITKANFLFQFATFNDWPEDRKKGPFKIGVVGNDNLYKEMLEKYASKAVGSQALEVHRLDKMQSGQYYHIIYVDGAANGAMPNVIKAIGEEPTLLVANNRDALQKGAAISFVPIDGMIRYSINPEVAKKKNITIGSRIQLWAVN